MLELVLDLHFQSASYRPEGTVFATATSAVRSQVALLCRRYDVAVFSLQASARVPIFV